VNAHTFLRGAGTEVRAIIRGKEFNGPEEAINHIKKHLTVRPFTAEEEALIRHNAAFTPIMKNPWPLGLQESIFGWDLPDEQRHKDTVKRQVQTEGIAIKSFIDTEKGISLDAPVIIDFADIDSAVKEANKSGKNPLVEKIGFNNFIAIDLTGFEEFADNKNIYTAIDRGLKLLSLAISLNNRGIEPGRSRPDMFYQRRELSSIVAFSMDEMLKNAFYHANNLDFQKPLYAYIDWRNHQISIINESANMLAEEQVVKRRSAAQDSALSGEKSGEYYLMADNEIEYLPFSCLPEKERTILVAGKKFTRMSGTLKYTEDESGKPRILRRNWPYMLVQRNGNVYKYGNGTVQRLGPYSVWAALANPPVALASGKDGQIGLSNSTNGERKVHLPASRRVAKIIYHWLNPASLARNAFRPIEAGAERYLQQDDALKGKAIAWVDRGANRKDLQGMIDDAAQLQAQGTNNVVVTRLITAMEIDSAGLQPLGINVTVAPQW
jgi:hypothetical protein